MHFKLADVGECLTTLNTGLKLKNWENQIVSRLNFS